jgi:hypothetical protein
MKHTPVLLAALFAASAAAIAQAQDIRLAEVDKVIQGYLTGEGPGGAVLVVMDGKVVHCRGYGWPTSNKLSNDENAGLADMAADIAEAVLE